MWAALRLFGSMHFPPSTSSARGVISAIIAASVAINAAINAARVARVLLGSYMSLCVFVCVVGGDWCFGRGCCFEAMVGLGVIGARSTAARGAWVTEAATLFGALGQATMWVLPQF